MNDTQTSIGEDRETRLRLLAIYAPLGADNALDRAEAAYAWVRGDEGSKQGPVVSWPVRRAGVTNAPAPDPVPASDADEKIIDPVDIPASLASMGPRQRTVLFALTRADDWAAMSGQTLEKATGIARQQAEQILVALRRRGLIERRFVDGKREIRVRPAVLDVLEAQNDPEPPLAPAAPVQSNPDPAPVAPSPAPPSPKPVKAAPAPKPEPVPAPRPVAPSSTTRDAPAVDYLRACGRRVLPSTNDRWLIDGSLDPVNRDGLWAQARKLAAQRGEAPPRPAVEIPTGGAA